MHDKTTLRTIEIQAVDTLFFRDARPFTMGDETGAKGIFPPSPSVLYGVLRSAYLAEHPEYISKAGTASDPTTKLRITAIALKRGDDLVLPLPYDLVKKKHPEDLEKERKHKLYTVYQLIREAKTVSHLISTLPAEHILRFQSDSDKLSDMVVENIDDGLITTSLFQRYVDGRFKQGDARKIGDYVKDEPKIGIARDDATHSSQEGALYRVNMQRPEIIKPLSDEQRQLSPSFQNTTLRFVLQIEGMPDFPDHGLVRMGGEGKAAFFQQIDEPLTITTPEINPECFKVYLATPAVFEQGWRPGWLKEETLSGTYEGLNLKLLAAAVGRYQPIGGFDMVKRIPKPLQRMVPAGSVYYFRLDSGTPEDVLKVFHQKSISDFEEYCRQGFGISYIAKESA